MAPQTIFYILAGCVAVAALVFVVMIVVTALRPPELPELDVEPPPPLQRMIRALTPVPFAQAAPVNAPPVALPVGRSIAPPVARAATPPSAPPVARPIAPPPTTAPPPPTTAAPPPTTAAPPPTTAPPPPTTAAPPSTPAARTAAPPSTPAARTAAPPSTPAARTAAPPSAIAAPPSTPVARTAAPPIAAPFAGYVLPSASRRAAASVPAGPVVPSTPSRLDRSREVARLPIYPVRRSRWVLRIAIGMFATSVLAAGVVVAYPAVLDPLCNDYEWFGADATRIVRQHAEDARAVIVELVETW